MDSLSQESGQALTTKSIFRHGDQLNSYLICTHGSFQIKCVQIHLNVYRKERQHGLKLNNTNLPQQSASWNFNDRMSPSTISAIIPTKLQIKCIWSLKFHDDIKMFVNVNLT